MKNNLFSRIRTFSSVVLLSLPILGCCAPPTPISVSGDGKLVSYSSTDEGETYLLREKGFESAKDSTMNLTNIVYDVGRDSILKTYPVDEKPISITVSRNNIAYSFANDEGENTIAFYNNGRRKIIRDADFPVLSHGDDCLAYNKPNNDYRIFLDYFRSGNLRDTYLEGAPIAFSPNLQKLLFLDMKDVDTRGSRLSIYDLATGKKREILSIMEGEEVKGMPYYPHWVDNETILIQNKVREESTTTEIFLVEDDCDTTRITENNSEELTPMMSSEGIVFYTTVDQDLKKVVDRNVRFSRNEKGRWKEYETKLHAQWTRISGDELIFAHENGKVSSLPLEDVIKGDNISNREDITKAVKTKLNRKNLLNRLFN